MIPRDFPLIVMVLLRSVGRKLDREGAALPMKSWERPERRRKDGRSWTEGWGKLELPSAGFIFDSSVGYY